MASVEPTPACLMPPYSQAIGPRGELATFPGPIAGSDVLVPRVVPSIEDALLAIFTAFPNTQILE